MYNEEITAEDIREWDMLEDAIHNPPSEHGGAIQATIDSSLQNVETDCLFSDEGYAALMELCDRHTEDWEYHMFSNAQFEWRVRMPIK